MRLHRFFINEPIGNNKEVTISDPSLIHQWRKVFRLHSGDSVILIDNSGNDFVSQIVYMEPNETKLSVTQIVNNATAPKRELYLFASIVKKDTYEWILEKGTELGVLHFVPIISDRSEKKDLNMERAQKIIKEAVEQSGRAILPELHEPITLEEALTKFKDIKSVAFDPQGSEFKKEKIVSDRLGVYIGPEGGWSERELKMFTENKIETLSIGTFTLRAETAVVSIISVLTL